MGGELVDPDRHLETEGDRDRVLAVRAARHRHRGAGVRLLRHAAQDLGQQVLDRAVRVAQHQDVGRLRDVLRGGAPVHPAAVLPADHPGELLDERHQGVARRHRLGRHPDEVQPVDLRGLRDRLTGRLRDEAYLGLRQCECGFDVEPCLESVLDAEEVRDPGVGHASVSKVSNRFGVHPWVPHSVFFAYVSGRALAGLTPRGDRAGGEFLLHVVPAAAGPCPHGLPYRTRCTHLLVVPTCRNRPACCNQLPAATSFLLQPACCIKLWKKMLVQATGIVSGM